MKLSDFPDPETIGSSEYRAVYEFLRTVQESIEYDDDPATFDDLFIAALDELARYASDMATQIRKACGYPEANAAIRTNPDT